MTKFVKDICPTAEIKTIFVFADKEDKPKSMRAALITFADPKVAAEWVSTASKKDVHMLDSEGIAKMLISEQA